MKKLLILIIFISFVMGCASSRSYDTSSFKYKTYTPNIQNIALNPNGLTSEQIKVISATKPPKDFPIDISVIFLSDGYIDSDLKDVLQYGIISELKKISQISRITIIPNFIVPREISFSAIQELGIRSLSNIVIVFNMSSSDIFQESHFLESKLKVTSKIDYMIVDSYSSAILTTDRLFSEKIYNDKIFKDGEKIRAIKEIFREQAVILGQNINTLFKSADNLENN